MENGTIEKNGSMESFAMQRNQKRLLMRVKPSHNLECDEDAPKGNRSSKLLQRCQNCCSAGGCRTRCQRLPCCRPMMMVRVGDTLGLGCCCRVCYRSREYLEIHVPVRSAEAIFDFDSCFAFPSVRGNIVEYIIQKTYDQLEHGQETRIVIQTLRMLDTEKHQEVSIALSNSFHHELNICQFQLARTSADGMASCIVSTIVVVCTLTILIPLAVYVHNINDASAVWLYLLQQFTVVVFWVALWNPVELLIHGRHMIRMRMNLCRTLAHSKVSIAVLDPEKSDDHEYEFDEVSPV